MGMLGHYLFIFYLKLIIIVRCSLKYFQRHMKRKTVWRENIHFKADIASYIIDLNILGCGGISYPTDLFLCTYCLLC